MCCDFHYTHRYKTHGDRFMTPVTRSRTRTRARPLQVPCPHPINAPPPSSHEIIVVIKHSVFKTRVLIVVPSKSSRGSVKRRAALSKD